MVVKHELGGMRDRETESEFIERRTRETNALRKVLEMKQLPSGGGLWGWLRRRLR